MTVLSLKGRPRFLVLAVALALLLFAACAGGGSETTPAATVEPPTTAAVPAATPTQKPTLSVASPCPISDEAFCSFAEALDAALQAGDIDGIIERSRVGSVTCAGEQNEVISGPCIGMAAGTVLEGFEIGIDSTDFSAFLTENEFRSRLLQISSSGSIGQDEYGNSTWRLAAIMAPGAGRAWLISTAIGSDPIYDEAESRRRVFIFAASLENDGWGVDLLFTTVFVEEWLTGMFPGQLIEGWHPWGSVP